MRVGVAIPTWGPFGDIHVLADFLALVEDLGFESAWFADHVAIPTYATDRFSPPLMEPLALAAWALARHERLRIGTDVLVAPYRHPILLAATAGSIARLSGGRLTLGMGIGYLRGEFAALQIPVEERAAITDEVLDAMRVLWQGEGPRQFAGDHFRFTDVLPTTVPDGDEVPLWVGGNGRQARRRAAQRGDGWHPLYPSPDDYARGRAEIESLRAGNGQTESFTYSYSASLCEILTSRREQQPGTTPHPPLRPEYRYAPERPRDQEGRPMLCGSPEQVARDIDAYRDAGVEHMVLRVWTSASRFDLDGVMDQLRQWSAIFALARHA